MNRDFTDNWIGLLSTISANLTGRFTPRERVACKDGFTMSVQASRYTYCTPREDDEPYYSAVEIGYPSEKEDLLMKYAETPEEPTETVYGYVPAKVVAAVIDKHGGVVGGECPPLALAVMVTRGEKQ